MQQLQRIAIYARVSSEQHSSGQTIASQLEALQARVSSDGQRLPADQCFVDDGYSGATLLRPALERLRDLATVDVQEDGALASGPHANAVHCRITNWFQDCFDLDSVLARFRRGASLSLNCHGQDKRRTKS